MSHTYNDARTCIRELNDAFRKNFDPQLGQVVLTAGVNSLPSDVKASAVRKTATFEAFTQSEHDFGSFELAGRTFFWKIDYYDPNLEFGSEDPADPTKTTRVLPSCSHRNTDRSPLPSGVARLGLGAIHPPGGCARPFSNCHKRPCTLYLLIDSTAAQSAARMPPLRMSALVSRDSPTALYRSS